MAARKFTTKKTHERLYSASESLTAEAKKELGVEIPFDVYIQDPLVASQNKMFGFCKEFVRWEPGLADGPTSARFAVVDYNNDTDHLAPMAIWYEGNQDDDYREVFIDSDGYVLDESNHQGLQYHQLHVWVLLQRALDFFEESSGLGRPIPFGFEGNRLIVVPHAGYGQNAFYDRESKSLQFYYFDNSDGQRVYTCLSRDIVNHEFGHAVLDGVRPYLLESSLVETGAFHEFIGDLTAVLLLLRNNEFRQTIAKTTSGSLSKAKQLSRIAEQFGSSVSDKPYLRSAQNDFKMSDLSDSDGPHAMSQVLMGAIFDILMGVSDRYMDRGHPPARSFAFAVQRIHRMAIQPLDLLPPVDVTFQDYALAVIRAEEIANPTDSGGYRKLMLDVFLKREILTKSEVKGLAKTGFVHERMRLDIQHSVDDISRSRAAAYQFLNDNRNRILIPQDQDFLVADLYDAKKSTRQGLMMPLQIVLEYVWREDIELAGNQFGRFEGQVTSMLCGGTLVFDPNGNVLSWFRKPGLQGKGADWKEEKAKGKKRKEKLLKDLAQQISAGHVGAVIGSEKGLLGSHIPPLVVSETNGQLQFMLSPHMHLEGEDHDHFEGGPEWEVSS